MANFLAPLFEQQRRERLIRSRQAAGEGALPMLWALKLAIGYRLLAISKKLRATSD
jgi:hypothetical protein